MNIEEAVGVIKTLADECLEDRRKSIGSDEDHHRWKEDVKEYEVAERVIQRYVDRRK